MKKQLTIFVALLSLMANIASALPGDGGGGGIPFPTMTPPNSDRDPASVNPFVDTLQVTLTGPGNETAIYYDINNPKKFKIADATLYSAGTPIALNSTSTLRAVSYYDNGLIQDFSDVASWQYNKDAAPSVNFLSPAAGQGYHIGNTVSLTASVTDDGPDPVTVKYYVSAGDGTWTLIGQGFGSNFRLDEVVPDGTAPGSNTIRAIATDGKNLTGSADVNINILANQAPVAHAGADTTIVLPTGSVTLNGSASYDPDDPSAVLKYEWAGPGVNFTGANTATPTLTFSGQGVYSINLKVTDQGSPALSSNDQVLVNVNAKPSITSADSKSGLTNAAFTYTLSASGFPLPSLSATGLNGTALPGWLTYSGGVLSGTPTSAGPYYVALSASNSAGTDTKTLTISITDAVAAPLITSAQTAAGAVNTAFNFQVTASGNPAPTISAVTNLPAGLSISAGGLISGVPTAGGATQVTLKAFNSQGTDTKPLTITITQPPAIATSGNVPSGNVGTALAAPYYTVLVTGYPPPTLTATGLPAGLSLNANGTITGTPSAAGSSVVTLTATSGANTATKQVTINIGPALTVPKIKSLSSLQGTTGQAFSSTLTVTGNPAPVVSASGPNGTALPAWLNFNSGVLSASNPPTPGQFPVLFTARNAQGTDTNTFVITIVLAPAAPKIAALTPASGTANIAFQYSVSATGNPTPVFSALGGPAWLTLTPGPGGTGSLTGKPPAKGNYSIKLIASNSQGNDTAVLGISISDSTVKPTITSAGAQTGKTGTAFAYSIVATGTSPITFAASALPAGLSLSGSAITGSPTVTGTFGVTLTATNAYGKDTKALTITVNADPKITLDLDTGITVFDKSTATFTVSASGFPALTYQWQYSATALGAYGNTGPNASTYTIDPVSASSAGYYRVIVKNGVGPDVTSKVRHLTIKPLPIPIKISAQPIGLTVLVGEKVRIVAKATGEPKLLYQWFKGNAPATPAPKVDDSVYSLASAEVGATGYYRAKVTNAYTIDSDPSTYAFSDSAKLTVQEPKLTLPFAKPVGGPFYPDTNITLATDTAGTTIYYTLNGVDPTPTAGTVYTVPIHIAATTVIKAKAYKDKFQASGVMTQTYTLTAPLKVIKPVIKPLKPTFQNAMVCSLSSSTAGAHLFYTTDGSNPLVGNPTPFTTPFPITATTTIIAVAKAPGMIDSDTLNMTYTLEKNPSKVLPPKISPAGGPFSGQVYVTLSSPADTAATIYYTVDGSSPDTSATHTAYGNKPIPIAKTTTVRLVAVRAGFINSDIVSETYKLIPGPITASQASTVFDSVITVSISALPAKAEIHYILDGTPTPDSPLFPAGGLVLRSTATISAIAILDSVQSAVYSFGYTLRGGQLATPAITTSNGQTTFKDSLWVSLTPPVPNAILYFTRDGTQPTVNSPQYTGPIKMDTTTTLQVIAAQKGYENSRLLVSTFTLVPAMPTVSPPGGISTTTIYAKIACSSKRASLFYTLNGTDPTPDSRIPYAPGDSIPILVSSTLKAVAVAGNVASPIREESYTITGDISITILPGVTAALPGGYTVRIPEDQTSKVEVRTVHTAPLKLVGFDGVQYAFTLALDASEAFTGAEFPSVTFTSPSSDKRSMYKVDPSGKVYFVSSADTVTLIQAGTYFMGIDTLPPVITYLNEAFEGDSTRVNFHITDNIANLSYDLKRNDDPNRDVSGGFIISGVDLPAKLKHPAGTLKPLNVQVVVSDYQQAAFFPPDPTAMLSLSQRLGPLKGPPAWGIGTKGSPYDLISIPLALNPPLTLKDLQNNNPGAGIEGADWDYASDTSYIRLDASTPLLPGKGYWIGSHTPVNSLSLPSANTAGNGTGTFTVNLHHGWNQIGNPHLEELYWPSSRNLGDVYKTFTVKGLWEYSPATVTYQPVESLKPWRGYYVYDYLKDTIITLSAHPVTVVAMKKSGAESGVSLSLGWGLASTLNLGADWTSTEGLGIEDEFSLPQRNRGLFMHALRGGHSLASDWIRMNPSGVQQWKIAMGGTGDSLPPLKVLAQDLPMGFETWAVSPSRMMKFKVDAGAEIPASGLAQDTLMIYSGTPENLAAFTPLKNMAVAAAPLDMRVSARDGGFIMQMSLPSKARFRAVLWGIDGTRKGELSMGPLSQGFYRFSWDADFRKRNDRLAPGMYFLSLEAQGNGLNTRLTRKIALSN